MGYSHAAIINWLKRAPEDRRARIIPTISSRPHHHPDELAPEMVGTIITYRKKYKRGAEVLRELLRQDGMLVSLSSVKRTLKRNELTYPSKWKKWHTYPPRPIPTKPGILVEIDTIHVGAPDDRLYLYTLIDVCSRWSYAIPSLRIGTHHSLRFVDKAKIISPFDFQTLQSDHGSEFSKWFTKRITERGMAHRHSRVRTPNDNAHLERFNRTIQDECVNRLPRNLRVWEKEIPEYLDWYNERRPHLGLELKTPIQKIAEILTPGYKLLT
jgi:transposase InsO family protein